MAVVRSPLNRHKNALVIPQKGHGMPKRIVKGIDILRTTGKAGVVQ